VTLRTGLVLLIVFSVLAAILKSVPEIGRLHAGVLELVLLLTTTGFAVEYLVRVWVAPEDPGAGGAVGARLRYVFSLPGLVDLIAGIPFALTPHIGLALDWLDIVPIFKLLRYTEAFQFMVEAVYSERRVLGSAAVLMLALLVFQSSAVYYFEREAQPDKFGSIPDAMWWGIVTLTTVGYGDVTPITPWGKVMGGLTAILGVCMFAIPVGIIASAFVEAVRRREFLVTWNLIASVPLFQNLDAVRIAALSATLRPRRAERGERLIRKGDRADSMYFIVSGEVEVDTATGVPPWRMKPGEFFGEVALIADRPRTANITAATRCRLLVLSKLDFDGFMTAHPEIAQAVRTAARKRLGEVEADSRSRPG
jgi:voltage-gated potassium channel